MKSWLFLLVFAVPVCAQTRFAIFGDPADKNVKAYQAVLGAVSLPQEIAQDAEDASGLVVPARAVSMMDGPAMQRVLAAVSRGALLITEGNTPLALALGLSFNGKVSMQQMEDLLYPEVQILWEKPAEVVRAALPKGGKLLARERWTGAPLVMTFPVGKGRVLWLAAELDPLQGEGYARFPYLIHHLVKECGVTLPLRSPRLQAFFDYGYRAGVDLDFFARRWRRQGVSVLHVSAWHFYDRERDDYLRRLIAACHANAILVYAWLELPHVSERVWEQHPEWREKTATLADARLDWRGHINLLDPAAFTAVSQGLSTLLDDFDWDGVNLAELYFESPRGAENESRFTPMNEQARAGFQKVTGFDPIELFRADSPRHWRKNPDGWRRFVDYRVGLLTTLNDRVLGVLADARRRKPHLDLVMTVVENLSNAGIREATGSDVRALLPLARKFDATLILEDPASLWAMGPGRYRELAARFGQSAGVDINIVDRYQQAFPTKKQTGTEFLQLLHAAAENFSPVLVYFEQSVYPHDLELAAHALASDRYPVEMYVGKGRPTVNGADWPVRDGERVLLPAGKHTVATAPGNPPPVSLLTLNADLIDAAYDGPRAFHFRYRSRARAAAVFSERATSILVDGKPIPADTDTVLLPPGEHEVRVRF